MAIAGTYAYVTDVGAYSALRVISIADPTRPVQIGYCDAFWYTTRLTLTEGYAYVAEPFHGVRVFDLESCRAHRSVVLLHTRLFQECDGGGEYVYVGDGPEGLRIASWQTRLYRLRLAFMIHFPMPLM